MTFTDKLKSIQQTNDSLLCVGLDTDIQKIPDFLRARPDAQLEFNRRIIDATQDLVCAYKINFAFYEAWGARGWKTIEETIKHIPSSIITIADAKRGDIGNSSSYYANAILNEMGFDSVTVAPYMGRDSVEPFLASDEKGVFLLALTSNEGARDFQMLKVGPQRRLFEEVIKKSLKWNTKKNLGYVVGATRASELKAVRALAPHLPLLIPGVGAQGGDLKNVVRYGCDANGDLAIVNASRSILYASKQDDFASASRLEAARLRDAMNSVREKYF
ncbi:MAG TPA: orotidine-5'-phosphate decarboxylase [Bacteroidota bacterium]|nr:orotidine-5'-phosphate decarboxylase [Bacteroidota bacterium]